MIVKDSRAMSLCLICGRVGLETRVCRGRRCSGKGRSGKAKICQSGKTAKPGPCRLNCVALRPCAALALLSKALSKTRRSSLRHSKTLSTTRQDLLLKHLAVQIHSSRAMHVLLSSCKSAAEPATNRFHRHVNQIR